MSEKRIVHDFGQIFNDQYFNSMATTTDNKTLFVCSDIDGEFREFDISTHKKVNNFKVMNANCCVVTYDNQFLITAHKNDLTKWSIQSKQQLYTWKSYKTVDS